MTHKNEHPWQSLRKKKQIWFDSAEQRVEYEAFNGLVAFGAFIVTAIIVATYILTR
jgi:hypothetical protein